LGQHHLEIISRLSWRFAKTMPETPHEYTVRGKPEGNEADYEALYHDIQQIGVDERHNGRKKKYLYPGDGWKYWAMTTHLPSSHVLNRMLIKHDADRLRREGQVLRDAFGTPIEAARDASDSGSAGAGSAKTARSDFPRRPWGQWGEWLRPTMVKG
jgi:hypothetical protein